MEKAYKDYYRYNINETSPAPLYETPDQQTKPKTKLTLKKKPKPLLKSFFVASLLFCAMVVPLLYAQYQVSAEAIVVEKLSTEINDMNAYVKTLALELEYNSDMNHILEYAQTNLNMGYASAEQRVGVELEKKQ